METLLLPQHQAQVGPRLVLLFPLLLQLALVLYQLLAQTGASLDVVSLVEADMTVVELVEMTCGGVEHHGRRRPLVSINDGRVVLREGDGAEDLPVLYGVHPHSVEVVALDLHIW